MVSYCTPNFISDYNYAKVVDWRRSLGETEEASVTVTMAADATPVDATRMAEGPSLALTGRVVQNSWSLGSVSVSDKKPRMPSARGECAIELQGEAGAVLLTAPLTLHPSSDGDVSGWAARLPMPERAPRFVVVRDTAGRTLLRQEINVSTARQTR